MPKILRTEFVNASDFYNSFSNNLSGRRQPTIQHPARYSGTRSLERQGTPRRKLVKRLALPCLATSVIGLLDTREAPDYLAALNAQYRTEVGSSTI